MVKNLVEKFDEYAETYLEEACKVVKEYEDGVCINAYYSDSDIKDAHNHAINALEEDILEAIKYLHNRYGVAPDFYLKQIQTANQIKE